MILDRSLTFSVLLSKEMRKLSVSKVELIFPKVLQRPFYAFKSVFNKVYLGVSLELEQETV